jgi:hypothetical protein
MSSKKDSYSFVAETFILTTTFEISSIAFKLFSKQSIDSDDTEKFVNLAVIL